MKNINITLKILFSVVLATNISIANVDTLTTQVNNTTPRVIVFGDSYSDNGNEYKLTQNKYPNSEAYYQGRFSNGPAWVEYLAKLLHINPEDPKQFINLAYGQAKILSPTSITIHGNPDKQYLIPNLAGEIDSYEKQYTQFNANDIVILFISTNDFFDMPPTNARDFFLKAADQQVTQIQRLIQLGAKNIIVLNGRDVTLSHLAKIVARANTNSHDETTITDYLETFRSLIQYYNHRLTTPLSRTKEVILYDVFAFDNQLAKKHIKGNKRKYVYNLNSMCYDNQQGNYQDFVGSICSDPKTFFFYDRIHTTSSINQLLAESVYRNLPNYLKMGQKTKE